MKRPRPEKSRIHEGLVGARALVGTKYLAEPSLRQQYDSEIAPRTQAALTKILDRLGPGKEKVRRVLDLGCGTGAAAAVVRNKFGQHTEIVAVDQVAAPGVIVADLTRAVRPTGVTGRFDLIIVAHVLNELSVDVERRARLVLAWCEELLVDDGLCLVVEPALKETSRGLLKVRDFVLARGLFVLAPCLVQTPCPALEKERDWCHDSGPVLQTGRSRVDFSYVVFSRSAPPIRDERLFRIVSDRMEEKGRSRVLGCGPVGRQTLIRLDRDESDSNRAFSAIARGDLAVVEGVEARSDGLRIGSTAQVTRG